MHINHDKKINKLESHLNPWESHQQRTIIIISSCQVIPEAKYPGRMNLVMSGSMRCKSYQKVDYSFLILHLVKRHGWLAFKADRRIYQKKSCGRQAVDWGIVHDPGVSILHILSRIHVIQIYFIRATQLKKAFPPFSPFPHFSFLLCIRHSGLFDVIKKKTDNKLKKTFVRSIYI